MRTERTQRELQRELETILARLGRQERAATDGPPTGKGDLVEDAQGIEAQSLGELSYARLVRRARTIREALGRLQEGRYGRCEECGGAIAAARLRAVPDTTTCLACQEAMERAEALSAGRASIRPAAAEAGGRRARRRGHHLGRAVARYSE